MENQYLDSTLDQDLAVINYGSFLRRFAATLIDGLIFSGVFFLLLAVTGGLGKIMEIAAELKEGGGDATEASAAIVSTFIGALVGLVILQWLYFAYLESSAKQGTLGKQAMGLIVTDLSGGRITFGKASVRHLARTLPGIVPYIGTIFTFADYLCQPFTQKKQTLHDMMAGTLVLKK